MRAKTPNKRFEPTRSKQRAAQTWRWATFMRIAVSIGLGLIICGCADQSDTRPEPQRWQRVSPVSDCVSAARRRGSLEGIPIVLEAKFKAQLLQQLGQNAQILHEPSCWYEISDGELLLVAGSCSCPVDFHFRNVASNWSLIRVEVPQCDVRCEELDSIRIDPTR
jgi:hypothetical protein